jgi:hypothetical protein
MIFMRDFLTERFNKDGRAHDRTAFLDFSAIVLPTETQISYLSLIIMLSL